MTRPMPGPPGCWGWDGRTLQVYCNEGVLDIYHDWWFRLPENSKTLTDAEVAAEYWREQAEWWSGMLQKGRTAEDVDLRRVATWHRFATHPHAPQGDPQ